MNGYRDEIPKWAWYTGQFLFYFQDQLERDGQVSVADCFDHFREANQLQNCPGFQLKNQGTLLMLLYGLLVIPREMWQHEGVPDFQFASRGSFHFCIGQSNMQSSNFLRFMRNAIAHANFDIVDLQRGLYEFWNIGRNGCDFKVRISQKGLCSFVTEVGQYYINDVAPAISRAHEQCP